MHELGRSAPHQQLVAALQHVPGALSDVRVAEVDFLEQAVARLLGSGRGLATSNQNFQRALGYQRQYDLEPADAIIYAAIISDLEEQEPHAAKLFVSRNWKDFKDPGILVELRSHNCRFDESFQAAVAAIRDSVLGA